jgi:DNA-binding transcriptional MerR regulator/GGDEF domain-containing protein
MMAIDKTVIEKLRDFLQDKTVQQHILENIQRTQTEARVTIGRAAELFDFSEARLREWDRLGLLRPVRSKDTSGQRQYSLAELSKLAIISELIKAGYSANEIPPNIDEIWQEIERSSAREILEKRPSIDQRVEEASEQRFWRYYASHALQLALALICENIPNSIAGLVLPMQRRNVASVKLDPEKLPTLGPCIVCWLSQNHTFHTFYTPAPSFEYPSDFRVYGLMSIEESEPQDRTYVVLQRQTRPVPLNHTAVRIIRRLLAPLYKEVDDWQKYLGKGFRDIIYTAPNFSYTNQSDALLTKIAERIIHLGGEAAPNEPRWRFCCILIPNNPSIPMQLRSLVVQAQSRWSPHVVRATFVTPDTSIPSLSLRAFQSGHILYRPVVSPGDFLEDSMIAYRELEEPVGSAIAIPVGGEDGNPSAIIYIVSAMPYAFPYEDQVLLRFVGRMIDELLTTYQTHQKMGQKLNSIVKNPGLVDPLFKDYLSQNHFLNDVEALLTQIQEREDLEDAMKVMSTDIQDEKTLASGDVVSFISIDIDNQSHLASKYGDHLSRNLSKVLGEQIQQQIGTMFTKPIESKLYHIYADRYFLLLNHLSLTQAREAAERLRLTLQGAYHVPALPSSAYQSGVRVELLELSGITVRLGVTSYLYTKLYEVLQRYERKTAIYHLSASIVHFLDTALSLGKQRGGNIIISWYPPEPPRFARGRLDVWTPSGISEEVTDIKRN